MILGSLPALLVGGLAAALLLDERPIAFESRESKNSSGASVFNEIRYMPGRERDVWMMRQSHNGPELPRERWDRLAIVVEKGRRPRAARFYQLEPGPLEWSDANVRELPFRASCFTCHSNGPRAIRPNPRSAATPLAHWDRARIALWNVRIKAAGRTKEHTAHAAIVGARTPLRLPGPFENEALAVAACVRCHNDSAWGRGPLTRQNFSTMRFMVENGHMPPRGFSLSAAERKELEKFLSLL